MTPVPYAFLQELAIHAGTAAGRDPWVSDLAFLERLVERYFGVVAATDFRNRYQQAVDAELTPGSPD